MSEPASDADGSRSASPAVTRAAAVLAALAAEPTRPMGPSELSRRTGTAKATVINVCSALADARLLRRSATGYLLGHRLAELGTSYLRSVHEVQEFYDCCRQELGTVPQTVQLSVLNDGLDVVYLARQDGSDPLHLGLASEIGRSVPAHCTAAGKALLAALPPEELDRRMSAAGRLTAVTEQSLRTPASVRAELDVVRGRRYATEHGEIVPGVRCIGAAVHTPTRADGLIAVSFTFRDRAEPVDAPTTLAELMRFTAAFGSRIGAWTVSGRA